MERNILNILLKDTGRDDLVMLVSVLSEYSRSGEQWLIDWLEDHTSGNLLLAETRINTQWNTVLDIIEEVEYGRNYRENDVFILLDEISRCCEEIELPWSIRKGIVDKMLSVISEGSDFADSIAETAYTLCYSNDEKLYYAHRIPENSSYASEIATHIYLECGDENNYVKLRTMHLKSGKDYAELADFYKNRGEYDRAAEVAEEGIHKCNFRIDYLYEWISSFYKERGMEEKLRTVYEIALKRNAGVFTIAEIMYKNSDTYNEKREYVIQCFKECAPNKSRYWFDECRKVLNEDDYNRREIFLHDLLRDKNKEAFLELLIEENRTEEVRRALKKAYSSFYRNIDNEYKLSALIADIYPEDVCEMYFNECNHLCSTTKNSKYEKTVDILHRIKNILLRNNMEGKWQEMFSSFLIQNKRKSNLIKLIKSDRNLYEDTKIIVQQRLL